MAQPVEADTPMMEQPYRPRVHVFGPFEHIVKFSGVDLTNSIFSWSESKKRGATLRATLSSITFILLFFFLLGKFMSIMGGSVNTFSTAWYESNINVGVYLLGIASFVVLGVWTHQQFFRHFHEKLDSLEQGPVRSEESFSQKHIAAFVMSFIYIFVLLGHSGRDFVYTRDVNRTLDEVAPNRTALWVVEPIARGLVGLWSSVAIAVYVLAIQAIGRKLKAFNKDLRDASDSGRLRSLSTLTAFSTRQQEILQVVQFVHVNVGKLSTFGLVGGLLMQINSIFVLLAHVNEISGIFLAVQLGFIVVGTGINLFIMVVPGKVQIKIKATEDILLFDNGIWAENDEKLSMLAMSMIRRTQSDSLKMTVLLNAFKLDQYLNPKLMLAIPLVLNGLLVAEHLQRATVPVSSS